jgi:hypothetical protein
VRPGRASLPGCRGAPARWPLGHAQSRPEAAERQRGGRPQGGKARERSEDGALTGVAQWGHVRGRKTIYRPRGFAPTSNKRLSRYVTSPTVGAEMNLARANFQTARCINASLSCLITVHGSSVSSRLLPAIYQDPKILLEFQVHNAIR